MEVKRYKPILVKGGKDSFNQSLFIIRFDKKYLFNITAHYEDVRGCDVPQIINDLTDVSQIMIDEAQIKALIKELQILVGSKEPETVVAGCNHKRKVSGARTRK